MSVEKTPGPIEAELRRRIAEAHRSTALGGIDGAIDYGNVDPIALGELLIASLRVTQECVLQLAVEIDALRGSLESGQFR